MDAKDIALMKKLGGGGGGSVTVDSGLSDTSTNPVQNKVIKSALDAKLAKSGIKGKTDTMTQAVGVDADGALWTAPGSGGGSSESVYELAATIEITEAVRIITQDFEKSYKELYVFFENITASQSAQIMINTLSSANGFAGTTAYYRVSRLIHRSGMGMERQDSTGHGTYGFWNDGTITRRYDLGTDADIDYVTIKPSNPNTTTITGGTFKIYGRV